MIIPVRCFSCGAVIAHKWEEFNEKMDAGTDMKTALMRLVSKDTAVEECMCLTLTSLPKLHLSALLVSEIVTRLDSQAKGPVG